MNPEVIIHNSISLDNAVIGFDINLETHYGILLSFKPDAVLAGSDTAKFGIDMFMDEIYPEEENDLIKPVYTADDPRPLEIIVDSQGMLKGLLHIFRRMEYTKDVLVLISGNTRRDYIEYLEERGYDYIVSGEGHVDLGLALNEASARYGITRIVSDSGSRLNGVLIDERLGRKLSLLVYPVIAGKVHKKLFGDIKKKADLELIKTTALADGIMHLVFRIL